MTRHAFNRLLAVLLLGAMLAAGAVAAAPASPPLCVAESVEVTFRDSRFRRVAMRVPTALHRPANRFRLYGPRPMTLWSYGRRRDLYRDAFLELATRSLLAPRVTAWDGLGSQMEWLGAVRPAGSPAPILSLPGGPPPADSNLAAAASALSDGALGPLERLAEPYITTLQLRALATDDAAVRLRELGTLLRLEEAGVDPAMRDGYRAAQSEFAALRGDLWSSLGSNIRRNGGRLLVSAVRDLALSQLGFWALFGYLGWSAAEGLFNAEYQAQLASTLATIGGRLALGAGAAAKAQIEYVDYAMAYSLTETFRDGRLMEMKAAGGRGVAGWRLHYGNQVGVLGRRFTQPQPGVAAGPLATPSP